MTDDTWTCHVCGKDRPDAQISVYTEDSPTVPGMSVNVRHCNDVATCAAGAPAVAARWLSSISASPR